jgi:hypothetical protein
LLPYTLSDTTQSTGTCAAWSRSKHSFGQFWLGLKTHVVRNTCLLATFSIFNPTQGQIQFSVKQCTAFGTGVGQKDCHLAVLDLSSGSAVLHTDPRRFVAALAKARRVNDHDCAWIIQTLQDVGSQIVAHQVGISDRTVQQSLHAVRSGFSRVFRQLPAIFPFNGTDNPFEERQRSFSWFGTNKMPSDAGMETFEFLTPCPDVDKGGFDPY